MERECGCFQRARRQPWGDVTRCGGLGAGGLASLRAHPQEQGGGGKAEQGFHLHCTLAIWPFFPVITRPQEEMTVPASWQEA